MSFVFYVPFLFNFNYKDLISITHISGCVDHFIFGFLLNKLLYFLAGGCCNSMVFSQVL